jgi:hypothetical protein
MYQIMFLYKRKAGKELLKNSDDQKFPLTFSDGRIPVNQPPDSSFFDLNVFFEVNFTQLHIDEVHWRHWTEATVIKNANDVIVRGFAKLVYSPHFLLYI